MKHFGFEFKKLIWTKKFLLALILLIAAISIFLYRNIALQDYAKEQQIDEISSHIKFHRSKDLAYDEVLEKQVENEEIEMFQEKNSELIESSLIWRSNINRDEDWRELVANEILYLETSIEYKEMGEEHPLNDREIAYRLALNEELLAKDIAPEYEDYSIATPNFTKQVVDFFVMYGSFFIVLLFISELLSQEFESRSILFLFTQPLKRPQIIFSKFLSAIVIYVGLTCTLLLSSVVVTALFGQSGNFNYPVIIEVNGVLQSMPIKAYLSNALIVNIVIIIFMIALYLLYSLLTRHTLLSLFLIVGTILLGHGLTLFMNWDHFAWFNPFQYVLSTDVILFQNEQIWYQGLPITLILAIVFLIITMQKVKTSKVG